MFPCSLYKHSRKAQIIRTHIDAPPLLTFPRHSHAIFTGLASQVSVAVLLDNFMSTSMELEQTERAAGQVAARFPAQYALFGLLAGSRIKRAHELYNTRLQGTCMH